MRLSTQIQDNACSHTNSTHSLFSPSPLEKRSSTLLLCYSCQCLVFTQPQTNHAHFSPEPNWPSRETSVPQSLWGQPHSFITSFGTSLCQRAGHRKPLHVRSRTPVSTELWAVILYTPLGPRVNFTEDSGSAGSPLQTPQLLTFCKHCLNYSYMKAVL